MKELEQILRHHAARYPKMEPTDAVKLIYQNEFGGGHLISDVPAFQNYLHREYRQTAPDPTIPLCEDIGNGIVRVHLAALKEADLDRLGNAFIRSASVHHGDPDRFLKKLLILARLTEEEVFSFDSTQLAAYLAEYKKAGCPAVSHSQPYRDAYHPAYRIIMKEFLPREFCHENCLL